MRCERYENSCGFGVDSFDGSSNSGFGIETFKSTSSGGFGVESPSSDARNYGGVVGSGVESVRNMLNINTGNTQGIAGGEVYSGTINSSYGDDFIDDLCDDIEADSVQSWVENGSGSVFGSAIKIVTQLYNKYFLSETQSVGNIVSDVDKLIVTASEEISSGIWDSSYRNIQLDGCIDVNRVESDVMDIRFFGRDYNGIRIDSSAAEILSASYDGADKSSID